MSIDGIRPDIDDQIDDYLLTRPLFQYYDAAQARNSQIIDYLCALLGENAQNALEKVDASESRGDVACSFLPLVRDLIDPDEWSVKWTGRLLSIELDCARLREGCSSVRLEH